MRAQVQRTTSVAWAYGPKQQQEEGHSPLDEAAKRATKPALEELEHGVGLAAVHPHFVHDGELGAKPIGVVSDASSITLLLAELVAWKRNHLKATVCIAVLLVEAGQLSEVLAGQASARRCVDHNTDFWSKRLKRHLLAVQVCRFCPRSKQSTGQRGV